MQNLSQPSCTVMKAEGLLALSRALWQMREFVFRREVGGDDAFAAGLRLGHEGSQPVVALRPHDEIDDRRSRDDLLPLGLGDAAGNRDQRVAALASPRLLGEPHAPELGIDLLRGLLPDMAGVENDEIGLGRIVNRQKACGPERFRHPLGIVLVHLAAEGLDMNPFDRRRLAGLGHALLLDRGAVFVKGQTRLPPQSPADIAVGELRGGHASGRTWVETLPASGG